MQTLLNIQHAHETLIRYSKRRRNIHIWRLEIEFLCYVEVTLEAKDLKRPKEFLHI